MSLDFEKVRKSLLREDADAEEASLKQTFTSDDEAGEKEEAEKEAAVVVRVTATSTVVL